MMPAHGLRAPRRDPAPIALLTLSNPGKRNALDPPLLLALAQTIDDLPARGVRAAVLTGAGEQVFCAGYDIEALPDEPDDSWLVDHGPLGVALSALSRSRVPVVAALNGPAVGSGCELALSCDLRVAHPGVIFQMPPVKLGLVYTPAGLSRLMALCGAGRARLMLLTARRVEAAEALSWGLCEQVVPREEVLATAHQAARDIAAGARLAVEGNREVLERLLTEGPALSPESARRILDLRRQAWGSADAREARAAFRARRPPKFSGA